MPKNVAAIDKGHYNGHLFCNALVRVIYSEVSGQYSYTIYTKNRCMFDTRRRM